MTGHVEVKAVFSEPAFTIPNVVSDRAVLQAAIVDPACNFGIENRPFGSDSSDLLLYFVRKNNLQMKELFGAELRARPLGRTTISGRINDCGALICRSPAPSPVRRPSSSHRNRSLKEISHVHP